MKSVILILASWLWLHAASAQIPPKDFTGADSLILAMPAELTRSSDDMAGFINARFATEEFRVRAIYTWITANIEYDFDDTSEADTWDSGENIVSLTLAERKGVCENYAALFSELCGKTGIRSYFIGGYAKDGNGGVIEVPHSWNAAEIGCRWYLFDTTWGAGYRDDDSSFVRCRNYDYFMVEPRAMIQTHMPFDPLWQFLDRPVTYDEFNEGRDTPDEQSGFNYADSIKRYEKLPPQKQFADEARRITRNGSANAAVQQKLDYIDLALKHHRRIQHIAVFEAAKKYYAKGTDNLNELVRYRKANSTKIVNTTQPILDSASENMKQALNELSKIKAPDDDIAEGVALMKKHIASSQSKIDDFQLWINRNK